MIHYNQFELKNGLQVLVHEDKSTPMAVMNLLYKVGSRNEHRDKTGFAHLFEHLMFGGSKNIPSYDEPLQKVGGENNAFTSPDITNYYLSIPAINIETGFWLESDRMLSLSFDPKVLEVQRKVVIEEFNQRYFNQPYGDVWLKLRPLAYQKHPYQWPTIGKKISHIEDATMGDVKDFFHTHYVPNNAILVVAGNVKTAEIEQLCNKWFAPIPRGNDIIQNIPSEPKQTSKRILTLEKDVPLDALYMCYHMPERIADNYISTDLISDILGRSNSSRLYRQLVKETPVFSNLSAYVTGSADPGLLVISGQINQGEELLAAEQQVHKIIDKLIKEGCSSEELQKVKRKAEASMAFGEVELLNRSMNLAYATFLGNPELVNQEQQLVQKVSRDDILKDAQEVLQESNSSVLYYKSSK